MKALSNVIAAMFLLIILIFISVSIATMLINTNSLKSTYQLISENYIYYHNLYNKYVSNGIIQIEYYIYPIGNGKYQPQLTFSENPEIVSVPLSVINITAIFCLKKGNWQEMPNNYPIVVPLSYYPHTINLPLVSSPSDIVILLNNGIMIFLAPNSTNY